MMPAVPPTGFGHIPPSQRCSLCLRGKRLVIYEGGGPALICQRCDLTGEPPKPKTQVTS